MDDLPTEKVLVIDDQPASREFIVSKALSARGYRAIEAETAEQAMVKAVEDHPDLIILNCASPNLGGLELLESLGERRIAVPVIALLEADTAQLDAHALELGVKAVITGLSSAQEVEAAVEEALLLPRLRQERDRLQEQVQDQRQEHRRLYSIGQAIAEQGEEALVYRRLVEAAAYIASADEAHIYVQDPDSTAIRLRAQIKQGQQRAEDADLLVHDSLLQHVLVTGTPNELSGPAAAQAFAPAPVLIDVPLKVRGRFTGILRVLRFDEAASFAPSTYHNLSVLVSYAGLAVANLDLLEGVQNAVERATLSQISAFFGTSLRLEDVLEMVMDVAARVVDAAYGYIILRDDRTGRYEPRASYGLNLSELDTPRFVLARQIVHHVLDQGEPHLSASKEGSGSMSRSALCVPIQNSARTVGVIYVEQPDSRRRFTERHRSMLTTLSANAAAAIENARLFDQVEVERQKLDTVLRGTVQPVIVTDVDGRVVLMNDAAHQAFAPSGSVGRGKGTGLLLPQAVEHPKLAGLLEQARISEQVQHGEISAGESQTFSVTVTPISGIGLVTVMQDITELKELSELKSEFVSAVSHDLRSPLSTIQGFLSVLSQAGPINEQQADFIASAQQEVARLFDLTKDLLDLGRLESGIDLVMQHCDLKVIALNAVANWRSVAQQKQHTLTLDAPDGEVFVHGDNTLLRQVLDNLINNAIKYTLPGGKIAVQLTQAGSEALMQVRDSGIGIAPKDQPFVFDRFYRAKNDYTRNIEGSGLGLAIVRSIVERHGGRVWLESKVSEGTTIGVVLPLPEAV